MAVNIDGDLMAKLNNDIDSIDLLINLLHFI